MITPYYDKGGITIYCGECLEVMPQLGVTVDAIITDLPYGQVACKWDVVIPLEPMWKEVKRILKPIGAFVTTASQPFTSMLVMSNLKWFKYEWIWEKDNVSNPALYPYQPMRYHENILVFYKSQPVYNPQMWDAGFVSNKPGRNGKFGMAGKRMLQAGGIELKSGTGQTSTRYPKSIIRFNKPKNNADGVHPTQKPVALYQYLIRTYTNPGDTVMDFCFGSGTTGVACQNEGRRFIGIEQDEDYCRIAVSRLCQPSLFSIPSPSPRPQPPQQLALDTGAGAEIGD